MNEQQADDRESLVKTLHAERAEKNTRNIDCWACEAAQSEAIGELLHALRLAQGARDHAHAVIAQLVPDEDERLELWRGYWRTLLDARHTALAVSSAPAADTEGAS